MPELTGRVFVLLDNGRSLDAAEVAGALAEAGAATITVHGEGRAPDGRGVFVGDPENPLDVETAHTMATELFGPVNAVLDLADLPEMPEEAVAAVLRRFPPTGSSLD